MNPRNFSSRRRQPSCSSKFIDHQDLKTCTIEKRKGTISVNGFTVARFWADENLVILGKFVDANIEGMQMENVGLAIKQMVDAVLAALQ